MTLSSRLTEMNLTLPKAPQALAAYVPARRRMGNQILVSGQLPLRQGKLIAQGSVPVNVNIQEAKVCAAQCFLNGLAAAVEIASNPDALSGVLQITGYVQSGPRFAQHPQIINGASDLAVQLFGEAGHHVRLALGASSLPLDAPVEISMIFLLQE